MQDEPQYLRYEDRMATRTIVLLWKVELIFNVYCLTNKITIVYSAKIITRIFQRIITDEIVAQCNNYISRKHDLLVSSSSRLARM